MRKTKKKFKNLLINLSLLFVTILVFLFLFETGVRLFSISSGYDYPKGMYQIESPIGYGLTPNFEGEFIKQEFQTPISTNSFGIRDVEYFEKEKNDYRILALGDSFTWGG